jgi:iron complex transport system substrate-binding protein
LQPNDRLNFVPFRLLLLICLAAPSWAANVLTDHLGRRVSIPDHPKRIVSLAPSLTETLFALGAGDRVVGVTDYCDFPAEAQTRAKIGGMINPNLERLAALHPDLVLITKEGNRRDTLDAVEHLKIPIFAIETSRLEDISRMFRDVGRAIGEASAGAAMAAALDQRVARVHNAVTGRAQKRVLMVVWLQPMVTVGHGTFLSDLLDRAGAVSIAESESQPWPKLSIEEIVRSDPDYIVVTRSPGFAPTRDELLKLPGWRELTAVKQDRIINLPDAAQRPGPRIGEMVETLARALHPSAFGGL